VTGVLSRVRHDPLPPVSSSSGNHSVDALVEFLSTPQSLED
jgi:hypothetical protein